MSTAAARVRGRDADRRIHRGVRRASRHATPSRPTRHTEAHGTIVVSNADHVLLANGYGLAARRARIRLTTHTLRPVTSVTKVFTALAIVQLAGTDGPTHVIVE